MTPISAGFIAAAVGFASSFAIVLQGLQHVGATSDQACSGLVALCVIQGIFSILLSLALKVPVSIVWSTPGAALLLASSSGIGHFNEMIGAFLVCAALITLTGLSSRLIAIVEWMPVSIANAMLAGVLFDICIGPFRAMTTDPWNAVPIILVWLVATRYTPKYATLSAMAVLVIEALIHSMHPNSQAIPYGLRLTPVEPVINFSHVLSLAMPLYIVAMSAQNIPGAAVLRANGYDVPLKRLLLTTGLGSILTALFGGHGICLSSITASLCAGRDAGPDKRNRYLSGVSSGIAFIILGLCVGSVEALINSVSSDVVTVVAGLALFGAFGSALSTSLFADEHRQAASVTFLVAASGVTLLGVSAQFWALVAGCCFHVWRKR